MIAWRYLAPKRAEGGIRHDLISLIGITLAVFALIATLSVRAGSGRNLSIPCCANAHVTVYSTGGLMMQGGCAAVCRL